MTEENDKKPPAEGDERVEKETSDIDSQETSMRDSEIDLAEANRRMYQTLVDKGIF